MSEIMIYVWLAVIVISLIAEASTATLVAIWFIPAALLSAVLSKVGVPPYLQLATFLVVSILLIAFARKIFSKALRTKPVPTNADALIGETAVVFEEINNLESRGLVKVKGQVWSAKSLDTESIDKDAKVEIVAIEGVKLVVKK